jgi:hypothetical protein
MDFFRRGARTTRLLTVIDEAISEKMRVTHNFGKTRKQHTHTHIIWV